MTPKQDRHTADRHPNWPDFLKTSLPPMRTLNAMTSQLLPGCQPAIQTAGTSTESSAEY